MNLETIINPRNWSIRVKLLTGFVLVALIPTFIVSVVLIEEQRERLTEDVNEQLQGFGKAVSVNLQSRFEEMLADFDAISRDPSLNRLMNSYVQATNERNLSAIKDEIRDIFLQYTFGREDFASLRALSLDGRVIVSNSFVEELEGNDDFSHTEAFELVEYLLSPQASTRERLFSDVYIEASSHLPRFDIVGLMHSDENDVLAALILTIAPGVDKGFYDSIINYWDASSFDTMDIYLVNKHGYLMSPARFASSSNIARMRVTTNALNDEESDVSPEVPMPELTLVGQPFPTAESPVTLGSSLTEGVELAIKGTSDLSIYEDYRGQMIIGYYAPFEIANLEWALLAEVDRDDALSTLQALAARVPQLILIALAFAAVITFISTYLTTTPILRLTRAAERIALGETFEIPRIDARDEVGTLQDVLRQVTQQLRVSIEMLETRVANRVRDLEATSDIARAASQTPDLDTLLRNVVDLIRDRFDDIYHAQVFLVDSTGQNAILRASTGEAGQKLLERGHNLYVGSASVIGQVTLEGSPVVARDTIVPIVPWKPNPLLPRTRAEMALPLRVGNQIIGALDLQSTKPDVFTEDDERVFQNMADQLAVAINNVSLVEESRARLFEIEQLNLLRTEESWSEYFQQRRGHSMTGYVIDQEAPMPSNEWSDLQQEAMRQGETVTRRENGQVRMAVPLQLRNATFGALEVEIPAEAFSGQIATLTEELVDRLAFSIDNARSFDQSLRLAEREGVVNRIAAHLSQQLEVEDILQSAIRQVGQALRVPRTTIRLNVEGLRQTESAVSSEEQL
jgi:GAF domain-containing protein/HAMP domain-containing protein